MSRSGSIMLTFLDGDEHVFRLAWGELERLEEERKVGCYLIFQRLHGEDWQINDIASVLKFGLMGGGMPEIQARKMVRRYVEERPPMGVEEPTPLGLARQVIAAAMIADEAVEQKKSEAEEPTATASTTPSEAVASSSPSSMATAH